MVKTKFSFFEQIRYAITKPLQYFRLTKVSGGRMTGFVFIFTLILSLFTLIPMIYSIVGPNGLTQFLREDLPSFEMSNGELTVSDRIEKEEAGSYVLVDTSVNQYSTSDLTDLYNQEVLISKTNMIVNQFGRVQVYNFSNLRGIHFDNTIIGKLMPFLYLIFLFVAVIMYIFMVAAYFFSALLYSLVGLIVAGIIHINLSYGALFKTAIYGKVTAGIISAIIGIIPVNLPGLLSMGLSILITCTYVVYGTMSHNSDAAREEAGFNAPPQNPYR